MLKHMKLTLAFLIFMPLIAFSQATTHEHPIDKLFAACLDSAENQTTIGMSACAVRAREAWDKELNKNYKLVMSKLSKEGQEKLKQAQRNWIAYRDKELELCYSLYGGLQGTIWSNVSANRQADITRTRALELKAYFDDVNDQ
jgi:uncharacterized protein YecT (DUF1311 family)